MIVIKKRTPVIAFRLGLGSDIEKVLLSTGKIVAHDNGSYEIFSKEAVNGKGELARTGDFVKLDVDGVPYPVSGEYFLKNHEKIGEVYYQRSIPLKAWQFGQPCFKEIQFLLDSGRLIMDEKSEERFFSAELWGTVLSANKKATIIIYESERDQKGQIRDVSFNFVDESAFKKTYDIIKQDF